MRVKNVEFIYKKFSSSFLTVALVLSTSLLFSSPDKLAFAETNDTDAKPDALQQQVEDSAKKYEEASARAEELQGQIDNNQKRIDEINKQIPEQQEKAGGALRQLYFLDSGFGVLLNSILGIEDLTTAINNFNYLEHIRDKNMTELESLSSMKKELDELQSGLDQQKRDADQQVTQAQIALQEAQAAREEAQRKAEEEAQRERKAAEEKAKKTEEASDSSDSNTSINVPNSDNADWSVDKQSFVNEWTPRIDSYLSGSPMSGTGQVFAEAAWDYGVDPRWSPAIAYTESSKGAVCFLPHNAWGWGSSSWGSWDEAIRAHVAGLKRGYGYTISESAAKKYCPPNWQHWYNTTSAQMNLI